MKLTFKYLLVLLLVISTTSLFAQIKGKITDNAGNAIADIVVSNGKNVVKTNKKGEYRLPVEKNTRFVCVSPPADYIVTGSFYLPYTDPKMSYNFVLERTEPLKTFNFIQITDTELAGANSWFREWETSVKDYAHNNSSAFIMHTGDICYRKGIEYHAKNMNTQTMGVPMYYSLGNHDLLSGEYGEQYYEERMGPVCYSFNVGKVHFMITPMFGGDAKPSYTPEDIFEWMKNDLDQLSQGTPVVIFNHDYQNIYDPQAEKQKFDLSSYNIKALIFGHWHNHFFLNDKASGIKLYSTSPPDKGGIDHSPSCFRVFHVDENGELTSETRYSAINNHLIVANPVDGHVSYMNNKGEINALVNAYHSASPVKSVKVKWDGDAEWFDLGKKTDFTWSNPLKAKPGARQLFVQAVLENGNVMNKKVNCKIDVSEKIKFKLLETNDWGNVRGNAEHNLKVKHPDETIQQSRPVLAWSTNVGANIFMSSPVLGKGKVFIATIDDDKTENCFVAAYDALNGDFVWRYKTKNSVRSNPVYENGVVVACDVENNVYGLDAESGKLLWTEKINNPMLAPTSQGIIVKNGIAYVGQQASLSAMRVNNGEVIWRNTHWTGGEAGPASNTLGANVLLVSSQWSGLYAHNALTGALLWKDNSAAIRFRDGGATFADDKFYLASTDELLIIEPKTGEVLNRKKTSYNFQVNSLPIVTDSLIITATASDGIVAFNKTTFENVWNFKTQPSIIHTVPYIGNYESSVDVSPILFGDVVYFGASDGNVYGLDAKTGECFWKYKLGSPIFSTPLVSGHLLLFTDFAGNIFTFVL